MSRNVRFKVSAQELEIIADFCHAVGQPIDTVAKQSLFWAINEAHKRAEEIRDRQKDRDLAGHPLATDGFPSGGAALADSGGVADQEGGTPDPAP